MTTPAPPSPDPAADEWQRAVARGRERTRRNLMANGAAVLAFLILAGIPSLVILIVSEGRGGRGLGRLIGLVSLPGALVAMWIRRRFLVRGQFG